MADKVYIQNGGIFFEPGSATEAVFVSNGQIHYQPDGAVAGGANPKGPLSHPLLGAFGGPV